MRERFEDSGDIGEVLLTLAGTAVRILGCPDFAREQVLENSDGHDAAQDFAWYCPLEEQPISWIELDLDAEIRPRVEAVRKALRDKRAAETLVEIVQVRVSHNDVEIEAYNGLALGSSLYALLYNTELWNIPLGLPTLRGALETS